jgi:hypothetical protein
MGIPERDIRYRNPGFPKGVFWYWYCRVCKGGTTYGLKIGDIDLQAVLNSIVVSYGIKGQEFSLLGELAVVYMKKGQAAISCSNGSSDTAIKASAYKAYAQGKLMLFVV